MITTSTVESIRGTRPSVVLVVPGAPACSIQEWTKRGFSMDHNYTGVSDVEHRHR